MELQIVGGGKMGQALLAGLIPHYSPPTGSAVPICVVEPAVENRSQIEAAFPGVTTASEATAGVPTILAVKPYLAIEVASALPPIPRLLSVAAGITTAALEAVTTAAVVRCMPNTPALLGLGASAVAIGASASDEDLQWGLTILGSVGRAVAVPEAQIDAVTGLSGSGPAYIFRIAEAMCAAGEAAGLDPAVAKTLAYQTITGAGAMLAEEGADASQLRTDVTTPNGTTAAGLAVLDGGGIEALFIAAVAAAAKRSEEMGRE